jgi:hypothetical protein
MRKRTRLSATDISALASMKNVAKCDTWCELQNPANHRVFERKLRPRPARPRARLPGRRAPRRRPTPVPPSGPGSGSGEWPPARARGRLKSRRPPARASARRQVAASDGAIEEPDAASAPPAGRRHRVAATPGQAGAPAEFKHINKRRRRNLRGFP